MSAPGRSDSTSVWFVCPAHGRFALSQATMGQWQRLAAQVAPEITLRVVVIADDENLEIARSLGFDTLERGNRLLGARYNDGFQHAHREGADYAGESGSRNLIHPDLLRAMRWENGKAHTGGFYTTVSERMLSFACRNVFGRGPLFLPRSLLGEFPRPVAESERALILHSICERTMPVLEQTDVHEFQYVGFYPPGEPHLTAVSDYEARWGVFREHDRAALAAYFDADVVAAALATVGQPVAA